MKAVFLEKKYLLTLIADLVLTLSTPFIAYAICSAVGTRFAYPLLFAIFGVINGFLAYIVGDAILIIYKNKNNLVTTPIPDEVMVKAKRWRYPFVITMLADLIVFAVFSIIFATTGHWPLL